MSSNSTSTNLSTENVITLVGMGISLCTSFIAFLTTIFTCTYMVLKSSFKDKQNTDIEISTETSERKAKIKISLLNDESYSLDTKKFDNKKEAVSIKKGENNEKGNLVSENNDLNGVLSNNNKGDEIIANTRSETINGALNTFLKLNKVYHLGVKGDNKGVLDVSSIQFVKQDLNINDMRKRSEVINIEVLGGNSVNGFGDDLENEE